MLAYIVRRLLLMIPTLFGIMVINFVVIQAAPGGPVEQTLARLQGNDTSATARISAGGGGEVGGAAGGAGVGTTPGGGGAAPRGTYTGADGLDPKRDGEVAFAGAGLADEVHHLVAVDEVQRRQGHDAVAVERGLEREVEAADGLDGGEPGHLQGRLDPAALAHGELLGQQRVNRLQGADLATLELLDHGIKGFQSTRHAQANEVAADALKRGIRQRPGRHAAVPLWASRLPTAS